MAAISFTKNAIFNLSRSFPARNPARVPSLFPGPSRVCFTTSASKNNEGRHAAEDDRNRESDYANAAKEKTEKAKETSQELKEKAKERTEEMKEKAKGYAHETKESMKGAAQSADEKAKEGANKTAETAERTKERVKEQTKEGTEKAAQTGHHVQEKAKETVEGMAEKAKQTVKGAWDKTKETTQKLKETVVGKEPEDTSISESDNDSDHVMNEDVVKARRRFAEDLKKRKD